MKTKEGVNICSIISPGSCLLKGIVSGNWRGGRFLVLLERPFKVPVLLLRSILDFLCALSIF
jgi:hypothetical protein